MIKVIIFDIDNTLYSFDAAHQVAFGALLDYAQRELGVAPDEFRRLHREMNQELKGRMGSCAAIHNRLIRYQNILERLGQPIGHALRMSDLYWNTLLDAMEPSPGAAETVRQLNAQGLKIGVGTDMTARMQFIKLERLGLLPYIDFLVSSEEAQAEKPAPALFDLCVEKAAVRPAECLFVGDNLEKDVHGAQAAGLHALWYRPQGAAEETAEPFVTTLRQLPGLLAADGEIERRS
ncbi:MAG: HAD-IA family hydrolase [Clostridiales bacterium]|nr:HAD-IA family hydrolase [Clostridiales bacterium]